MKIYITILVLLLGSVAFCQSNPPNYAQIAFDRYRTEIIDSLPIKKKIKVYKNVFDYAPTIVSQFQPMCLPNISSDTEFEPIEAYSNNLLETALEYYEFDFTDLDKTKFKIKKIGKGGFPKLSIGVPYKHIRNDEQVYINIYVRLDERTTTVYHFKFDPTNKVQYWCQRIVGPLKIAH
jgi:hypothetical protein